MKIQSERSGIRGLQIIRGCGNLSEDRFSPDNGFVGQALALAIL